MDEDKIKTIVREGYAKIARQGSSCCAPKSSCCGTTDTIQDMSKHIGYSEEEIHQVPEGSNLGLGCGNPVALASLKKGETVLDLGSGAGFDCFLAANAVGENGRVIGVDMTPEMISKARENARKGGYENVEFRLGEIENLPVADNSVDLIMSNCVINLSPDKRKVFTEAFRVLRPGGRMMISDVVLLRRLPEAVKNSVEAYIGCVAGASMRDEYLSIIRDVGFQEVQVVEESSFSVETMLNDPIARSIVENSKMTKEEAVDLGRSVASINVSAAKP